jgi:Amt family ammonium transporter
MLVCSALVLMMTGPGLALFYGGLVRKKNVLATMMQSFILMAVITVLWALVGYSLSFAKGSPFFGGLEYLMLKGVGTEPSGYAATIPHLTFMVFPADVRNHYAGADNGSVCRADEIFSDAALLHALGVGGLFPLRHMVWGDGGYLNAFLGGRSRHSILLVAQYAYLFRVLGASLCPLSWEAVGLPQDADDASNT